MKEYDFLGHVTRLNGISEDIGNFQHRGSP